jgi:multidrug efflux pump subunit AcrA (membrane-fusion protein)
MEESTLSFARDGIVSAIHKKEWDIVGAGELIAEIDAGTADLDLESAKRNLSDAEASFQELFDTAKESDITKAKATLEESESSLKLMESEYESLILRQKNTLAESEENLALLKEKVQLAESEQAYTQQNITTDTDTNNLEKDIMSAWLLIESIEREMPDILKDLEDISYVDNQSSDWYGDIWSQDTTVKTRTDRLYQDLRTELSLYQTWVIVIRNTGTFTDFDTVNKGIIQSRNLTTHLSEFASLILQELDATPSGRVWSSDRIDTAKSDTKTIASTLSSRLSSLNSTYTTLKNYGSDDLQALADKNTLSAKEQSVTSLKNSLAKAERDLELLKKEQGTQRVSSQNELARTINTITQNQYNYSELLDGPDASEIRSAKSKVESARIALQKVQENMKDYQIIASFSGTVEDIPWKVGESAEMNEGILVANKDTYKIELTLDQIDIVKVQEGQPAQVVLDAFSDKTFTGEVLSISATPTITSGVVSYTAVVGVVIEGINVLSSMSTTVTILVSNKENILLIPSGAITAQNGKSSVQVRTGRGPWAITETREVTLWIVSEWKTEILSGLTVGETIMYSPVTVPKTSTTRSSNTTIRTNTMGGMGGGISNGPPPGGF